MTKPNRDDTLIDELGSRIDALQKIPLKTSVIIAISLASFFTYYDITNFSYISPILKATWNIGDTEIAYGASMTIFGYVIGAISITVFADTHGRKIAFILSILLLGLGSILAASSQDMTQMALFRLLTGIGIGAEIAIVATYIGEMSPKSKRGKYTSAIILIGWAGLTSSGPISFLLIQQSQVIGIDSWRIVLAIAGTVALISLPFRIQMPESFRWLLVKGKVHQLNSVLMTLSIAPLEANNKTVYSSRKFSLRTFKNKPVMLRVLFFVAIWFLVLIPVYASLLLVVEYVNQGYSLNESISINIFSSIGFVAGGVLTLPLADKIERKHQIAIASTIMSIAFILRGFLVDNYNGLVVAGFIAFASNAWLISSLLAYTSESFPTKVRSFSSGIIEGTSRGLAAVGPILFVLFQPSGFLNLMIIIASFSLTAAVIITIYGSKTSRKSLEEISREES
ncbi:MAG: MFS transporter [Nitrososphaeraceae archaeon]|nr:MFS transporter [Nitrososphaeraceae archaeon]